MLLSHPAAVTLPLHAHNTPHARLLTPRLACFEHAGGGVRVADSSLTHVQACNATSLHIMYITAQVHQTQHGSAVTAAHTPAWQTPNKRAAGLFKHVCSEGMLSQHLAVPIPSPAVYTDSSSQKVTDTLRRLQWCSNRRGSSRKQKWGEWEALQDASKLAERTLMHSLL